MKLFLEKISADNGLRKFKIRVQNDALTNTETGFEEIQILLNNNNDINASNIQLIQYNNHMLYDVDSFRHAYNSNTNEDNEFILPVITNKDFVQYSNYDFGLSKEIPNTINTQLDKYTLFNRYQQIFNTIISYDDTDFASIDIQEGMTEDEIYAQLEKVFGSANEDGTNTEFIGTEYNNIHNDLNISSAINSLPFSYVLETNLTKNHAISDNGYIDVNLFKTKNHLKNDYNTFIEDTTILIWRRYKSIGLDNSDLWLAYSVDFADNTTNEYLTRNYETIERLESVAKYKLDVGGSKSNVYSIRIHNSGLNNEGAIYDQIRSIFEKSLFNLMTKIAPAHTQLWKIDYLDQ